MRRSNKRTARPWARRHKGGWIITRRDLADLLTNADAVQVGGITVGARNLKKLVALLPSDACLLKTNGRLEVETVETVSRRTPEGHFRVSYRKPRHNFTMFRLDDGAWLPKVMPPEMVLVVMRPKKFA